MDITLTGSGMVKCLSAVTFSQGILVFCLSSGADSVGLCLAGVLRRFSSLEPPSPEALAALKPVTSASCSWQRPHTPSHPTPVGMQGLALSRCSPLCSRLCSPLCPSWSPAHTLVHGSCSSRATDCHGIAFCLSRSLISEVPPLSGSVFSPFAFDSVPDQQGAGHLCMSCALASMYECFKGGTVVIGAKNCRGTSCLWPNGNTGVGS